MLEEHLRAAREALAAWDIDAAEIKRVSMSENIVFRVDAREGRRYVLRLHRPWYHDRDELISEQTWTAALRAAGVDVPVPVPTRHGDGYTPVDVGGERRYAGMLEWVEGTPLYSIMENSADPVFVRERFALLGEIIASVHQQATSWTIPDGFRRHVLDADGFMGEQPFWGRFWESHHLDTKDRRRLASLRQPIHDILTALGTHSGTFSLIHADLHAANVIAHDSRLHVIDFDDAGFGWHAYEFAVALYHHQSDEQFDEFTRALVEGYRRRRPVDDETVALVPLFLLIRSLASIGWVAARPELDHGDHAAWLMRQVDKSADGILVRYR